MKNVKLVATDLDGTFLRNDRTVSSANRRALKQLGAQNVIRVAATGRNFRKVKEVIDDDVPFDYVVFSSGAGVFDQKKKEYIFKQNIGEESAQRLMEYLMHKDFNFFAFYPVPDNHQYYYYRGTCFCDEFERYFAFSNCRTTELVPEKLPHTKLCQLLLFLKENNADFEKIKEQIEALSPEIRVIRASSPITKGYIWLEVFHYSVSKGNGIREICRRSGIEQEQTMGVGNDYNDFDLLEFTRHSFLTANSPEEIKGKFPLVASNENDAFAEAVSCLLENGL